MPQLDLKAGLPPPRPSTDKSLPPSHGSPAMTIRCLLHPLGTAHSRRRVAAKDIELVARDLARRLDGDPDPGLRDLPKRQQQHARAVVPCRSGWLPGARAQFEPKT